MNNTFNLRRFILLFKKHSLEHVNTYLLSTGVLAGVLALVLGFLSFTGQGRVSVGSQGAIFIFAMVFAGSIFTSLTFADLGDKRKATQLLTLPASHLEKFLVAWVYSYIIFQLLLVGVFYLIDWTVISVSHPPVHEPNTLVNIFDVDQKATVAFLMYAIFHAIAIWGALFFEKLHFIKTAFIFFIYVIVFALINNPLLHLISGFKDFNSVAFGQGWYVEGKNFWTVRSTPTMDNTNLFIFCAIAVIFWISAFFRLKEKEI